ncbi:PPR CONTAINING PLANT-LIKE PROTEIN [Salix viminalis]|uniref:PPR CONTAINING PLANT-LIKE PROTEIN n=1 Tax=Salix viminalis TaxID=40686 RepID=A0A9Q0TQ20_SALVM|nr:PPR CONTAINING PLANT-LIKE PROTEIN [Salix viminalis]
MLNSDIVLQVLMNYKQLGRVKTLEFFSWAGMQMGFKFDDSVIEYMVDFLGRRKLFDDMKCFLMTVLVHNGRVTCRALSICIRFLGRQGRFREALCLFQEMETKFNCRPDNFVYNNMLYVLCLRLPLNFFKKWVGTGLVPTRSAVNFLLRELCLLSAKEGAVNEVRVHSSRKPYTILVPNVGPKSGAIRPAVGVFLAVFDFGLLPSTFVIIQLITELCRLGKTTEACEILKVIEERKLNCVAEGYSIVMQALCEYRLVDEASHLFGRMLSLEFKPKLVVYNSIICMLCKVGRLDDAQRVFQIMSKKRCLPDSVTYTALVHAYGEARNWEAAYDLLMEMLGLGWIPHFHAHTLVDRLLREHGRIDLSDKIGKEVGITNLA